ncbi:MAG: glycosyltransferase family 2 protein [Patescibacteria group bacterium]
MEVKFPIISVVIATFNSARTIERCLSSLSAQNYPKEKIDLIVADGGSTDKTKEIVKKFGGKIVEVPKEKQGAEYNKGYGLQYITGEFILLIDHDNILPHRDWLNKMLAPLLRDCDVVAVEPLRYRYSKEFSLLDRYFALFGVNDPLPYYLGKADRLDYIHNYYNLLGKAEDKGDYYLVEFDQSNPRNIPTLGANGFLIRRSFFEKSEHSPERYFHIDINVDLIKQGYTKYAFIKDDIIHLTNSKLFNFLRRRKSFMDRYYLENFSVRRYSVYYPSDDKLKLLFFIILTLTLIKPMIDSVRGWLKVHDIAWFFHPFMCLVVLYIYGLTAIKGFFRKKISN